MLVDKVNGIIQSSAFEKAVVKLQRRDTLTPAEKCLLVVLQKVSNAAAAVADEDFSFEEKLARSVEAKKVVSANPSSLYRRTLHILLAYA